MRFPTIVISSMWPQMVLQLWMAKALLLPLAEVLGAPTLTSTTGRSSRGDRTVPPSESIHNDSFLLPGDSERTRREAIEGGSGGYPTTVTTTEDLSEDDSDHKLWTSSRDRERRPHELNYDYSSPGSSVNSRSAQKPNSDDDYYYYYYYDSFVEGVTTRDGLEDYSEHGVPVDLEDTNDDDGEIMELLNLAARQKKT